MTKLNLSLSRFALEQRRALPALAQVFNRTILKYGILMPPLSPSSSTSEHTVRKMKFKEKS